MPSIKPFKGVIYNKDKVKDIAEVVAPPYDIIPKKLQEELYGKSPYNIVRLELNKIESSDSETNNRYTRSRDFFRSCLDQKVLVQDDKEALYIYSLKYKVSGKTREQLGFLGLLDLGIGKKRSVLPHENTLAAPKADRLNLIREVRVNTSPIFILYDDKAGSIEKIMKDKCLKTRPFIDIDIDGVRHRLWRLDDGPAIKKINNVLSKQNLFIADGHHRFEVASNYAREIMDKGLSGALNDNSKFMMVYLSASDDKSLTVLPTHRMIKDIGSIKSPEIEDRLKKYFTVQKTDTLDSLNAGLRKLSKNHAFGLYFDSNHYLLKLKDQKYSYKAMKDKPAAWKSLDVSILHEFIFKNILNIRDSDDNIEYTKDPKEAVSRVDSGEFRLAVILNPTKVSQVKEVAKVGERMPKKSTYFYPKPLSGLVINKLD